MSILILFWGGFSRGLFISFSMRFYIDFGMPLDVRNVDVCNTFYAKSRLLEFGKIAKWRQQWPNMYSKWLPKWSQHRSDIYIPRLTPTLEEGGRGDMQGCHGSRGDAKPVVIKEPWGDAVVSCRSVASRAGAPRSSLPTHPSLLRTSIS